MVRRRLSVLAGVLGVTVLACQLVAGIERVDKVGPPPPEAGPDTSVLDSSVPDPCKHVRPPPPPTVDDAPNDSIAAFYLALREVTLVPKGSAPVFGFDLDKACTCDTRPGTAFDGGASCASTRAVLCDADGGVDNQVASALRDYAAFIDIDNAANINARIARGEQTSIIVITSYNGLANDRDVKFGLFTSEGIKDGPGCAGSVTDANGFSSPGCCGEDNWTASASTVDNPGGNIVPKSVGAGYVTNYEFVVELDSPARVPFGGYRLTLGSPISRGRLVPLDDKLAPLDTSKAIVPATIKYWRVEDSVIGGRVPASELLAAMGTVNTPGDSGAGPKPPLCTSPLFGTVKQTLCDQIDINSSKLLDFIPSARCDAISIAISLTGGSVRVTRVEPVTAATNVCYPTADGGGPVAGPNGVDYQCP